MGESNLISTREVAKLVGKTERHIQLLAKDGNLTVFKNGNKNVFDKYKVIREYIDFIEKKNTKEFSSLEDAKLNQEIRWKSAKADMVELELEEMRGNLHRAEDVEEMTTDLVMNIRSAFMSLAGRVGVEIVNVESAAEVTEIINKEVYDILDELSRYEYDPDKYKQRVRERQGWIEKKIEEDEEENSE